MTDDFVCIHVELKMPSSAPDLAVRFRFEHLETLRRVATRAGSLTMKGISSEIRQTESIPSEIREPLSLARASDEANALATVYSADVDETPLMVVAAYPHAEIVFLLNEEMSLFLGTCTFVSAVNYFVSQMQEHARMSQPRPLGTSH